MVMIILFSAFLLFSCKKEKFKKEIKEYDNCHCIVYDIVPFSNTFTLDEGLTKKVEHKFVVYPNLGHGF